MSNNTTIKWVEADPDGINQHEKGAKLDSGKADMSLLLDFHNALTAVAEVATAGAKKYSRGGWLHVVGGYIRYTAAMLRHTFTGEEYDKDISMYLGKDIMHDAQVAWNALARLELKIRKQNERKSSEGVTEIA